MLENLKDTIKSCAARLLLAATLLCLLPLPAVAQHNYYMIHDSLYPIYQRAVRNRTKPSGLATADNLYNEAKKINDTRAMCLAYTIPMFYHFYRGMEAPMLAAVNELKAISEKYGHETYYYNACNNYVNFLVASGEHYRAMAYAQDTYKYAERHNSKLGILRSTISLGNIHSERLEDQLAIENYGKAIKMADSYGLKSELPNIYYRLCVSYCNTEQYQEALKYAEMCLKETRNASLIIYTKSYMCLAYFFTGQYEKFNEVYTNLENNSNTGINDIKSSQLKYLSVMKYIINRDFNSALRLCDSISFKKQRLQYMSLAYYHMGDYENAFHRLSQYVNFMDSSRKLISSKDLSNQEADINRDILNTQHQKYQFYNTQLALAHSKLNLEIAQHAADTERINARNSLLLLQNNMLEASNMEALLHKKTVEQAHSSQMAMTAQHRLRIIVVSSCIILALFAFILLSRVKLSRRLKQKNIVLESRNKNLIIAQAQADQDDKLKEIFLKNMSHEIRTPLNAIVGFSQILADDDSEFSDEDKIDFANRIEENSDIVQNIINSILDLTSIESGHYQMQSIDVHINSLCRSMIDSVRDMTKPSVKLQFITDVTDDFTFKSDAHRIGQVIQNLLSNAAKNTANGSIVLQCSAPHNGQMLLISVTDTGIGIPDEYSENIFERFFKIDNMKQGIGLGLSISLDIAQFLNGKLYLDKNYMAGARFIFEIPINSK